MSFSLAPDVSRDIVVGLKSITARDANGSTTSLLPSPILTFIDSTLPYIYLPPKACQLFEDAFGLVWNETLLQYLVDDALHESLLAKNPNFTFQIGDTTDAGPTVDIVLPYASFDLIAEDPLVYDTTRYFPIQPGNETQYTLGRTFLQEAYVSDTLVTFLAYMCLSIFSRYLITNYEHSNFSVCQCRFDDAMPAALITIPPVATPSSTHVSRSVIIGASIGATSILLLIILLSTWGIRRWRPKKPINRKSDITAPLHGLEVSTAYSVHEIAHNSLFYGYRELPDSGKIELQDEKQPSGSAKEILELPPEPPPVYHELMAETVSNGPLKLEKYRSTSSTKSKTGIYVSTRILTNSRSSEGGSSTPRVETIITSSTRDDALSSNQSSRSQSPWPKPLDLDRPLPPTPISESPQVSPITPSSKRSGRRRLPIKAPPNSASTSGTFEYVSPTSSGKNSERFNSRGHSPLSESSMVLEIVIPPGDTEPNGTIYSSPTSLDGEGMIVADFF